MYSSIHDIIGKLQVVNRRPYLVGIDGLSGAGKSTLASQLEDQLANLTVVHKDDFCRVMDEDERAKLNAEEGYHMYSDWERLRQQVLIPLSHGETARFQRYDWPTGRLAETLEVVATGIVVVEGVTSTRPELRGYYDLTIWVETNCAARHARQEKRNENPPEWIARWAAAEAFYRNSVQPHRLADMTIAGE